TDAARLRGINRSSTRAGTNAAIPPDSRTPRTRNGSACTQIATNTVTPVRSCGALLSHSDSVGLNSNAASSTTQRTSVEVIRLPGRQDCPTCCRRADPFEALGEVSGSATGVPAPDAAEPPPPEAAGGLCV